MDRTRERMPMLPGRLGGALALSAAAVLIAACAAPGGGATTGPTTAPATVAPATDPPMSAPPTAAPAASITLELATDATLGAYVVGEGGMSLYIFTPDARAPGKSTCNGDCATAWPPLTVDAVTDVAAGTGVTGTLGTVTRDDGALQVTLGGWPLYYFAGDKAAGDVAGQGLNDVWYLAGPDGKGIGAPDSGELEY